MLESKIWFAPQPAEFHFHNPITGQSEPFTTREQALDSILVSAGEKIRDLEREIVEIRSYLVMD